MSNAIAANGDKQWTMTGDLTVRGRTRTVTVPIREVFYESSPAGGRGRYKGAFSLKRFEYGLSYQSRLNPIEDEIQIQWEMSVVEKS